MKRILFLFLFLFPVLAFSQTIIDSTPPQRTDSLPPQDTVVINRDSLQQDSARKYDSLLLRRHDPSSGSADTFMTLVPIPQIGSVQGRRAADLPVSLKTFEGEEVLFYSLIVLLLIFAMLRQAFAKYFADLFRLFFRTTLKQRQIRDQLMQTPLPSLLFNVFFFISAGLYVDFMLLHFKLIGKDEFWLYYLYSCLGLSAAYLAKFIGLKILGWIFNFREAADSYIFVVFAVNKVIGIFLLPFIVMIAFLKGQGYLAAVVLSWIGVGALILYRYILTHAAIRNQVKFNPFHFFLYVCAFEIAPLLLIYKLLLVIFR